MENKEVRALKASEVDCRVARTIPWNNTALVQCLLYKNARVDMQVLDETFGAMNWQREHSRDNANCRIGVWDAVKCSWVWKEDTGTESNTEAEKGLASDSFKRAGFNWGIGRELYTAPEILIPQYDREVKENFKLDDKGRVKAVFEVTELGVATDENGAKYINSLVIVNTKLKNKEVYRWAKR